MVDPARSTARCPDCGARVFPARVPADVSFGRLDVMLDATARPDGPMWVDADGTAHAVVTFYRDGAARYTPHARVCRARRDVEEWQDDRDRDAEERGDRLGGRATRVTWPAGIGGPGTRPAGART